VCTRVGGGVGAGGGSGGEASGGGNGRGRSKKGSGSALRERLRVATLRVLRVWIFESRPYGPSGPYNFKQPDVCSQGD